ncbi:MAG: A/G-specific adenine glycosylase [Candidatus Hydrogenedentes bacterium]|nr:A/G-specific adenine glycosylase [Candidatus Hydrogenedentota bacterium]
MTTKNKRTPQSSPSQFRRALLTWYRRAARDLPWRRTTDPYAIWLSEIMLQQTRVDQGLPYFERFISAFPTVQALAAAKEDRVLKLWEGLGYYSRARNLHRAAKIVADECGGVFPRTAEELQSLPGVGRYTAGAIASIAYGERVPVLDGNVIRVLSRLYNIADCTDDAKVRDRLWKLADRLVPAKHPGDFNQAMMELGARICTPKSAQCGTCPARRFCAARVAGVVDQRPVRKAKAETPRREMVAAVINQNGRYLLVKRPSNGLLGGLWEFPCGTVHNGETHQSALIRGLGESLGVRVKVGGLIASVQHAYSHFRVSLHVYACAISRGELTAKHHDEMRWSTRQQLNRLALPKVVHKFLGAL